MKRASHAILAGVLVVAGLRTDAAEPTPAAEVVVTVNADETRPTIHPFLYGQFIEHLGRCIYGGIWAEMLEDRKFYFPITARYDPYTSLRDTPYPVVGRSPWEILGPAEGVTMVDADAFVGRHTPRLAPGAGIRHRDLGLKRGQAYTGYLWLKAPEGPASVEVALAWGDGAGDRDTARIDGIGREYARFPVEFTSGADTVEAMLEVRAEGGPVLLGTLSLMPADNVRGMRADTLALLKQLDAPMYRWPGGNFVSGYDWRDGIGDRDRRPPRKNPAWTGVEHNDFGLDEYLDFCRELGTEPMIAVNTGLGDAYSAAQEVEYVNGSTETIGGARRAANGHPEPYDVTYWCVGNEMWGTWQLGFMQLKHYTFKHNQVADAMWAVDRSLKLVGSGQLGHRNPRHDPDERRGWSEGMLAECADHMDYISEHFYSDKIRDDLAGHVRQLAKSIREKAEGQRAVQRMLGLLPDRPVPIAMDEWNYWHQPYVYGELGCVYDLSDALGVAIGLHEYFRQTDIIAMAHYAQTVNVIGCVKTTKTDAFLDATALPLLLYRRHFGSTPVAVSGVPEDSGLDVSAAWTEDRDAITIGVVNPTRAPRSLALKVEGADLAAEGTAWIIAGDDPATHNSPEEQPLSITERPIRLEGAVEVAPLSIHLFRVPSR